MADKTDAELVALARSGDKNAFGHLIERYQQMARRVAIGVVRQVDLARELANETMLQAYLSLDRLRDDRRFQSWLYGIVLNVCRSYFRDQRSSLLSLEAIAGGLRCWPGRASRSSSGSTWVARAAGGSWRPG